MTDPCPIASNKAPPLASHTADVPVRPKKTPGTTKTCPIASNKTPPLASPTADVPKKTPGASKVVSPNTMMVNTAPAKM